MEENNMKEIGGYIELDTYHLPMLHEGAIALNCGRNALAYLMKARKIKRIWIPRLICDSVTGVCEREGVPYSFYGVGMDFLPREKINLGKDEWFYFVNYYSQHNNTVIGEYVKQYKRVIVDNAQSYFQPPIPGIDTIYSCRKYFGVADGAFLYTSAKQPDSFAQDESFERMHFILGRFERSASEYYQEYVNNNKFFANEPIKLMSKLTLNLLHGIEYEQVKSIREKNYSFLHQQLSRINLLKMSNKPGTFMYPLMLENGAVIRKKLQSKRIYIPMLWPSVFGFSNEDEPEHQMANNILPLPVDQRYSQQEMKEVIKEFVQC